MSKLMPIRIAAALMIAGVTIFAAYRLTYLPWRADVERKSLESITLALWERQPTFAAVRARQNVAAARTYLDRRGIHNTGLYMTAAANYRLLDDFDGAAAMYYEALRFDRRPELYYNLGLTEVNRGRRQQGVDILIHAGMFNPFFIQDITESDVRNKVEDAVHARRFLPWRDYPTMVH
jgi:tetratricopeptide (TPR) repeat protein